MIKSNWYNKRLKNDTAKADLNAKHEPGTTLIKKQ